MALFTETWDGTSAGWPAQWFTVLSGAGTVVDRVSGYGRMATGTTAYGRCGALNITPLTSTDYTLVVDMLVPILSEWYAFVHVRGDDGLINTYKKPSSYQIRLVGASGGVSCEFWQVNASGTETYIRNGGTIPGAPGSGGGGASLPIVAGDTIRVKIEVSGTGPVTLKEKAWVNTGIEPPYTDLSASITATYTGTYFSLSAQGGNNTTSEDIKWEDLTLTALSTPSTQTTTLPFVTSTQTLFSPGVTPPPQAPVLPLVTSAETLYEPTVATNALAITPLIEAPPTIYTPTVIPNAAPVLPLVTNTEIVFSPRTGLALPTQDVVLHLVHSYNGNQLLDGSGNAILDGDGQPIYIDDTPMQTVFPPTSAIITGSQAPVLPLVTSTQTLFDVTVTAISVLPLVTSTETLYEPTLTQEDPHLLPLVVAEPTVFAFDVTTTGTLAAILPRVTITASIFAVSVTAPFPLAPVLPLVVVVPGVFAPRVSQTVPTPVLFTFEPPHDEQGPRQLSEYGRRRAGVSKVANQLSGYYGGPRSFSVLKLNGVYVQIQGPTMDQINASSEYYAGGHVHDVTAETAAALEAAGFEVQGYP